MQVLFVLLAFAIMAFSSYRFGVSIERGHLTREAENMFINIESQLESALQEFETMLGVISETARVKLLNGASYYEMAEYITDITDYASQTANIFGFKAVFAMFNTFSWPEQICFSGESPDIDWAELLTSGKFIPEERDWYIAAVTSRGRIVVTDPYIDFVTGEVVFTYARAIYDNSGERIAIICIDVTLDRIYEFASERHDYGENTWMLLDNRLNVIAHSDDSFLGLHLQNFPSELANVTEELEQAGVIKEHQYVNHVGESRVSNIRQLKNGWFLGVSTLTDAYYTNLRNMQWFLTIIGFGLSAMLSAILVRLAVQRNRAVERTELMLNSSPHCINIWDSSYTNIDCNQTAIDFFGLRDKQEYKERFFEFSPELQPDGISSRVKTEIVMDIALKDGYHHCEWMYKLADGELCPIEITLVRVKYKKDFAVIVYVKDMRKEKAMVQKIAERDTLLSTVNLVAESLLTINSNDSFEDVLIKSMEVLSECNDDDRIHIWRNSNDDEAQVMYHSYMWQRESEYHKPHIPLNTAVPYDELPGWKEYLVHGNIMHGIVSELPIANKKHFELYGVKSVVAIPLHIHGRLWGVFSLNNCRSERTFSDEEVNILRSAGLMMAHAIMRDQMLNSISEEHEKTENLAHWYHSILDAIPLPISVTDENMKWTFVNSTIEQFLGTKRKDLMGKPCSGFGYPICNTDKCGIACFKRGEIQTFFDFNGFSFKADVAALRDLNGEAAGHVEIAYDITEIEMMAKSKAELESASNAKSAFLATVSHEIRTPMNTILGISEIQLQNENHSPETEEAFSQICDAGDLLLNIINDILDLSKIEAGKLDIIPGRYDIPSLINDSIQLNYLRYENKPIKFNIKLDADTPLELYGDEFRIKQVFNNLLSNAFKYTDEGVVELAVSCEADEAAPNNTVLIIKVSDTGVGMNKEQLAKLFDEFARFTSNRTVIGTGLGMSITKRLIDLMNGDIFVESTPGKGTLFTVRLPQKRVGSAVCGKELTEKFNSLNFKSRARLKKTQIIREYMPYGSVLVVDDVASNLQVAKGMLSPYGLKIETASSGFEAIDKIKQGNLYDIIFMDHMMPMMDGIEAVGILRKAGYKHAIIALTANAVVGQEDIFLKNGFNAFISKPIDTRELNVILNDFIRNKKPREMVEAARRKQEDGKAKTVQDIAGKVKTLDISRYFADDAKKAVELLEGKYNNITVEMPDADVELYEITVHGMKSALANIGEKAHSAIAYELEKHAKAREFTAMAEKTPAFIESLKELIEKYKT
jgi:PAS domain S-box-containing protein